MPEQNLSLPEDITGLSVKQLNQFVTSAKQRARELYESETTDVTAAVAEADEMSQLATDIERVKLEQVRRADDATSRKAEAQAKLASFASDDDAADGDGDDAPAEPAEETASEPVAASAAPRQVGGATTNPRPLGKFKNPSLADAQRQAPSVPAERPETVMIASADIPGFGAGQKLQGMEQLVAAMQTRARSLPVTAWGDDAPRVPIASLMREHKFSLSPDSSLQEFNEVMTAAANPDILVAAGGWCAPSEISYDFFNIACNAGRIDIPTIGINRGGIRWPTSASFADVVLGGALWTWTETQDIAAVTGTAQSGVKTCGRVPCASFNEARLRCDGICLTVGNLTEDAFPELIANHTDLVMKAHDHKMNRLYIDAIRALSAGFTVSNGVVAGGTVANVLGAIELQAIDYRDRYAMCEDALIEVIAPRWLRGVMRSDLRRQNGRGTDALAYTDAQLMALFDAANVRIQWVDDYQVRTAGFPGVPSTIPTTWPSTVEFLMYAPGSVVLGRGMRLDLGIIRDSVLNATNDYTAEWMEECWLMFQPGHEVRRLTVAICANGNTGLQVDATCTSV